MQTTPKANNILGHFFALLGAVVMLAIATWVSASSSEQVKPLDNLATPRTGHTATALSDGRILITGGRDSDGHLVAASEIFNPETQTSSTSGTLHTARVDHSATVLADGRVLVAGGIGANGALSSAEIFDPAHPENGFVTVGSTMSTARTRHTATLLNDGHVLIAGGDAQGSAELFDPATGTFMPTIWPLTVARSGHTATLFTDDTVLLAGGNSATMETYVPNQGFTLDPATMSVVRTGHWAFELSDTRLLLFQGDTGNTIDEFNPGTGTITPKGSLDFHASSSSLLANGKVLVLGTDVSGLYDPNAAPPAPDFTAFDEESVPNSGGLPRSGQAAVELPGDKKILISGGVNANNQLLGQALYNPARIWTDMDNYVPGEQVILSGSGWKANEDVYLFAVDNINQQWTFGATVTAGADGSFVENPFFIVQLIQQGAQFHVTAVGQSTMQADVYFTDAPRIGAVTVGSQSGTLTYGTAGSATFTVATQRTNNGTVNGTFSVVSGLPAGATASFVPATFTANGGNPFPNSTLTVSTTASAPAGTYNITVRCADGGDVSTGGAATLTIGKATPTVVVTPYTCPTTTYTGLPHTATVTSITGVNGETGATVGTVNVSNTTHTNAGTYSSDTWSFTGTANYNNIVATTITDCIAKANATVVVTPYTCPSTTYTGLPHTATVTSITGVNGETGATVGTVNVSNTTHTSAGTYSSDTWSFTGTTNYNNISATTITDCIAKANATVVVTPYTCPSTTYDGSPHTATVTSITGVNGETGATVGTVDVSNTTHTNAGTYSSDTWSFTGTANYNNIAATTITDCIAKANATVVVTPYTCPSTTYDGSPHTATVTSITGVNGETGTTVGTVDVSNTTHTNAGTYTSDTWSFTGTVNYNNISATTITDCIGKANATVVVTPYTCPGTTYTGLSHTATYAITGVNGETGGTVGTVDVTDTIHTNAGIYNGDQWSFTGTANYNNTSGTVDDCIAKAAATVVVTPYTCPTTTYTGLAHTASYTINGVNGESGATVGAVNVSGTSHTNAGTYNNDPWSFTGTANYEDQNGTVNDCIAKAVAVVVVTPYTCPTTTYTGFAHMATYTITGVNGESGATVGAVNVSGTSHTNAGTYNNDPWSFTGTANYEDQNGTVNDCIAKAVAVVVVTPYTCPTTTYTGFAHMATYTITGVNGETGATVGGVNVSGTSHTNAGTYNNDPWSFTGTANYEDQNGTVNDCIAKADATFTVTAYSVTYNGNPHTATVSTITGVNGETGATVGAVNVSGTIHTDAGTYNGDPWTFTATANYNNQSGTVDDYIGKADATFTVTAYSVTYNGNPHTATVSTITGVNGETGATVGAVSVTGTIHTDAGTYNNDPWSFTGTANYNNQSGTVDDYIGKADATFTVTAYSVTYNGNPHTATVSTITGVNGETGATVGAVDVTGTTHTNANTYNGDPWTFTATANYNNQSGTVDDYIGKADATFTVTAYSVTYNGNPHTATVSTITGVNGETGATVGAVDVTGTTHTNANTYNNDPWTFTATANYNNQSGTVNDYIGKADATFTVTAYSVTYNGNPHTATVSTITGVNGETGATVGAVDVTGTTHTNAGTYNNDPWTFTGTTNYNNQSGTVDDYIDRANATVMVVAYTCPSTTYTGLPHTATVVSITGVNGETGATVGTVDVSNTTHTNAGTYAADYWFFTGAANYNNIGNTMITDCIAKANATVVVAAYTCPTTTYTGLAHTATVVSITGVNGETGATVGIVDVSNTTHTNAGTYAADYWFFTGAANYNNIGNTTITDCIAKANATVVVTAYTVTYDCNSHTATYTITGVNGESGATVGTVDVSHTTHTNAGTYNTDYWFFTGTANYNNIGNTTITDTINKANTASSVTSSVNPSIIGQTVTFTATVAGNPVVSCKPTGTVTFKDGSTTLGTGTLNSSGQATFPTSTLSAGSHSITVVYGADSNFNGSTSTVLTQSVNYTFIGFLPPIDNLPILNTSKAGQTIPVKWQLKDYNGNLISDLGTLAPNGLGSQPIACDTHDPLDDIEELSAPGGTVFRFDGTQFIYNWQTSKPWANTCRLLVVTLADGTVHTAQFKFK